MSDESRLPEYGWLQECVGCGIITSKFIKKKNYKLNGILTNNDLIYICLQCQKNKKIVKDVLKNDNLDLLY